MEKSEEWIMSKSYETNSHNFIKTALELAGYKVMKFGIENHNQDIIKSIKSSYSYENNRRLMSMPDFVVVDPETNETSLIEIKHRNFEQEFSMKDTEIAFKYSSIKSYVDFWKEATLILTFNVTPYCVCIDVNQINWNIHFKGKFMNAQGNKDELWNFAGIYQLLNVKFPKVTSEIFKKALGVFQ